MYVKVIESTLNTAFNLKICRQNTAVSHIGTCDYKYSKGPFRSFFINVSFISEGWLHFHCFIYFFQGLQKTLLTNTTGPLLMAKHFSALLKKGSGLFGDTQSKKHASVLINMSARVGSITDNSEYLFLFL